MPSRRTLERKDVPPSDLRSRQVRDGMPLNNARHQSVRARVGLEERLFEIESHPVVEFVAQGTDRHKTFMLRTTCHGLNLLRMRTPGPRHSSAQPVTARRWDIFLPRPMGADVRFVQNVKIVPNSLRHECA